ncbi:MAG: hypothetical protein ACYSWU_00380 [Planctomycetota bacterium]
MTRKQEVREKAKAVWAEVHGDQSQEVCNALLIFMLQRERKKAEDDGNHGLARNVSDIVTELMTDYDY